MPYEYIRISFDVFRTAFEEIVHLDISEPKTRVAVLSGKSGRKRG